MLINTQTPVLSESQPTDPLVANNILLLLLLKWAATTEDLRDKSEDLRETSPTETSHSAAERTTIATTRTDKEEVNAEESE
jgi:hypothetical protein